MDRRLIAPPAVDASRLAEPLHLRRATLVCNRHALLRNAELAGDLARQAGCDITVVAKGVALLPGVVECLASGGSSRFACAAHELDALLQAEGVTDRTVLRPDRSIEVHRPERVLVGADLPRFAAPPGAGTLVLIEAGDFHDGVIEEDLAALIRRVSPAVRRSLIGVAINVGCGALAWSWPRIQEETALARDIVGSLIHLSSIEVSIGGSALIPESQNWHALPSLSEFRVGEAILLGTATGVSGPLPGWRQDGFLLASPIVDASDRRALPGYAEWRRAQKGDASDHARMQASFQCAVRGGFCMTDPRSLQPPSGWHLLYSSSGLSVFACETEVQVGDMAIFRPGYEALVRLGQAVRLDMLDFVMP